MLEKRSPLFFEDILCTVLLIVIFASVVLQVVNRWLVKASIPWTEELARYCFVWLSCVGISLGVRQNRHMNVDLIDKYLSEKNRCLLGGMVDVVFVVLCFFVVYCGMKYVSKLKNYGQKSAALQLEAWVIYLAGPVGFGLSLFRIVQKNITLFRRKGEVQQ
jgi:TRAP-type C4-dicarboxylate transport system permease small subunit